MLPKLLPSNKSDRGRSRWKICNRIAKQLTQQPVLKSLTNRAEGIFKASWYRAEKNDDGDTRDVIERMAKLRLQKQI
jgi:Zn-dependent oligopeptidase